MKKVSCRATVNIVSNFCPTERLKELVLFVEVMPKAINVMIALQLLMQMNLLTRNVNIVVLLCLKSPMYIFFGNWPTIRIKLRNMFNPMNIFGVLSAINESQKYLANEGLVGSSNNSRAELGD